MKSAKNDLAHGKFETNKKAGFLCKVPIFFRNKKNMWWKSENDKNEFVVCRNIEKEKKRKIIIILWWPDFLEIKLIWRWIYSEMFTIFWIDQFFFCRSYTYDLNEKYDWKSMTEKRRRKWSALWQRHSPKQLCEHFYFLKIFFFPGYGKSNQSETVMNVTDVTTNEQIQYAINISA